MRWAYFQRFWPDALFVNRLAGLALGSQPRTTTTTYKEHPNLTRQVCQVRGIILKDLGLSLFPNPGFSLLADISPMRMGLIDETFRH